jgi:hypothetical protein
MAALSSVGWAYLFAAGVAEVVGTILLKYSVGFSRPMPTLFCLIFMVGSLHQRGLSSDSTASTTRKGRRQGGLRFGDHLKGFADDRQKT